MFTVNPKKPFFLGTLPSDVIVPESGLLTLDCEVGGWPTPSVQWYKDSQLQKTSGLVSVLENGTLNIRSVSRTDAGNYMCLALNIHDGISANINVTVACKFYFSTCDKS